MHLDLSGVFRSCDDHMVSPDSMMLPKVDSVEHIQEVRHVLGAKGHDEDNYHRNITA